MSAVTEKLFRGSDTWPNLALGSFFALIGLVYFFGDDPGDKRDAALYLLFAVSLLSLYFGARLGLRAVQWVGLAAMVGGILTFVLDLFGLL